MNAICFKCGVEKQGALVPCGSCAALPKTQTELLLSLMFSEHLASKAQLVNFSHEVQNHLKLTIPPELIEQAKEALRDPQLMAMIGLRPTATATKPSNQPIPASQERPRDQVTSPAATPRRRRSLKSTSLHQNPFALLGATTRDDRRRIVELAEEKALQIDHAVCQKARADLTAPRTRLALEIAWMPGVSPRRASQLLQAILDDPMSIREASGLPTLAHLNLMAAAFEAVDAQDDAEEIAEFIQEVACLADALSIDDVLRDINEDRSVSGFPEIRAPEQIEAELAERKRYFRNAIKDGLNRLPPAKLLTAMTSAVESATNGGDDHAPELLDELVDSYAVEAQGFLQKESENVHKLIKATRESAKAGESAVKDSIGKLEAVARNWEQVARPIQVSAKARGIDHEPSKAIALSIRDLAVDLFNKHGLLKQSQHLTEMVSELFADLPDVVDRTEEDRQALADIAEQRKQLEARRAEWEQAITYRAEVGLVFKDVLSISPEGVRWKEHRFPLESITGVRWGAVRNSVNGIPTGTDYTIGIGSQQGSTTISLGSEKIFSDFLNALWRAVCIRLIVEMGEALKAGRTLSFGDITIDDNSVTVTKHKFLGANERVRIPWGQGRAQVWSYNGEFVVGDKDDKKTYASASYIEVWNTHVLEHVIRGAFKKGINKLSDYFED
jgi:hypothetical protein